MKYVFRTVVGLGLEVGAIVGVSYAIYLLLQVGTCASGGPYEIARECPEGLEWLGLAIPASIFVMLFGGGLYAARGAAPGSSRKGGAGFAVLLGWSGLFLGIAFACFWGVWGPGANPGPGAKEGGLIVGFLFVPMGLFPLWATLSAYKRKRKGFERPNYIVEQLMRKSPVVRRASVADAGGGDSVTKIERLLALREQGAITQQEFEKLKAEVLGS